MGYIEALLDTLETSFCIDLDMIYITGFSNGGIFSWQIGMSLASRFAAISPGGGQPLIGFLKEPDLTGGHTMPVLDVHGEVDTICPPWGGVSTNDTENLFWDCEGFLYTPVSTSTRLFANAHDCFGNDEPYSVPGPWEKHVTCYNHGECPVGVTAEFVRCTWRGTVETQFGGHFWPELPTKLDGSRFVWWFFLRHPFVHPTTPVPLSESPGHKFYGTRSDITWMTQAEYRRAATRGLCPNSTVTPPPEAAQAEIKPAMV